MRRLIATLLILAVATIGVLISGCGFPNNAIAKVGNTYIYLDPLTKQVDSYASQNGITKQSDPEMYKEIHDYYAPTILENLVNTELAVQKAPSLGITATDAEVQAVIDSYSQGDPTALEAGLKAAGMTMADLKKQITDYILYSKVRELVTKDVPEASDEAIAAYYEENKANLLTEQTVDARHILVTADGRALSSASTSESATPVTEFTDIQWARALATAAQLRLDLLDGGSWSRLASRYSDDPASSSKGGALGTLAKSSLVNTYGQEFDTALFALELNQISDLVKTASGYHIIQVTKINEPRPLTLAEAKADIAVVVTSKAKDDAWLAWLAKAKTEVKVTYRNDYRPTTTTVAPTTTTQVTTTVAPTTTVAK